MRASTQKISAEEDVSGIVRFTAARDTFFLTMAITKQEGQEQLQSWDEGRDEKNSRR